MPNENLFASVYKTTFSALQKTFLSVIINDFFSLFIYFMQRKPPSFTPIDSRRAVSIHAVKAYFSPRPFDSLFSYQKSFSARENPYRNTLVDTSGSRSARLLQSTRTRLFALTFVKDVYDSYLFLRRLAITPVRQTARAFAV